MKNPLYPFSIVKDRWSALSTYYKIILVYIAVSTYFYYIHESHLSIPVIGILVISTLVFSVSTLFLTISILDVLFQNNKYIVFHLIFFLFLTGILYFLGFFKERAGLVFYTMTIIIVLGSFLLDKLAYKISFICFIILVHSLSSFSFLQFTEVYLLHIWNRQKYGEIQEKLTQWNLDEKNRILGNSNIPLYMTLPEGMYYHSSKSLSIKNKSGIGQFLFLLAGDQFDISTEPVVRFFILPASLDKEQIESEYEELFELWKKRGEVEELKKVGERILPQKKWKGNFWIFFNRMTPKYNKIGYYIMELNKENLLLIEILENLVTGSEHSKNIEPLLQSITDSIQLQINN